MQTFFVKHWTSRWHRLIVRAWALADLLVATRPRSHLAFTNNYVMGCFAYVYGIVVL